jgi:ABC-2 type transport system permease protein
VRAVFLIARHDLRRRLRDRTALITGFVAPLAMAAIIGLAFGTASSGAFLRVAIADEDHTPVSQATIDGVIANAGLGRIVVLAKVPDAATALAEFRRGTAGSAVIVHRGFAEAVAAMQHQRMVRFNVESITSRKRPYAEQVAQAVVGGIFNELSAAALAVRTSVGNGTVTPERLATLTAAFHAQALPVVIADDAMGARKSLLGYFGPSMAIVFLFLGIGAGARSMLGERDTGTLARLKAAPVGIGRVVAGKVGAVLLLALCSIVVVWVTTTVVFGASWGPVLAVLTLSVATVLAFGGIALLLTVSSRNPARSDATMAIVAFVLALLGGNFFPPGSLPPVMERLSLLTPNGWALQGYGNLALDRSGWAGIHLSLVVLLTIGLVLGGIALTRLRSLVAG